MNKTAKIEVKNVRSVINSEEIQNLMWGYLSINKKLSQRSLAIQIANDAKRKGKKISIETIQRSFGKSAKHVQPVIKEILLDYYHQEGYKTNRDVISIVTKNKDATKDAFSLIASEEVNRLARLWVSISANKSKRLLAKQLKAHLESQGYHYHLGSLQNILCGKILETKKIIYYVLREILILEKYGSEANLDLALGALTEDKIHLYESVPVEALSTKCTEFLTAHPEYSKRKLAIRLSQDLAAKGYEISYNSLQYALAGKRGTVKKIVETTLDSYFVPSSTQGFDKASRVSVPPRYERLNKKTPKNAVAKSENPEAIKSITPPKNLDERQDVLRKIWEMRKKMHQS